MVHRMRRQRATTGRGFVDQGTAAARLIPPNEIFEKATSPRLPAWLGSLLLHTLVLVGLVLLIARSEKPPTPPPDRPVQIALTVAKVGEQQYFHEDRPREQSLSAAAEMPTTAASSSSASPFPQATAEVPNELLAALDLPDLSGSQAVGGANLLGELVESRGGRPSILPGQGDEEIIANDPARNRPAGPTGPIAEMRLFGGAKAAGRSFVFLIDRSNSMGGEGLGAIEAAERELKLALSRLEASHRFGIVAYNQKLSLFSPKLLSATPENQTLAGRFLAGIVASGATEHAAALRAGLRERPDVIFLLSDGGEPPLTTADRELITRHNGGKTAIHCIRFGFGPDPGGGHFLATLARQNGGTYSYVNMSNAR